MLIVTIVMNSIILVGEKSSIKSVKKPKTVKTKNNIEKQHKKQKSSKIKSKNISVVDYAMKINVNITICLLISAE